MIGVYLRHNRNKFAYTISEVRALMKIRKDMPLVEALAVSPVIPEILVNYGMLCLFCNATEGVSVLEACKGHGMTESYVDDMIEDINDYLANITPEELENARDSIYASFNTYHGRM